MSQLFTLFAQDGIVMGADSRISYDDNHGKYYFDSAYKLFCTSAGVGISTCGNAGINGTRIQNYIADFVDRNSEEPNPEVIANLLLDEFKNYDLDTTFHVCGYHDDMQKGYRVYTKSLEVVDNREYIPGCMWNGDNYVVNRLLNKFFTCNADGTPGGLAPYRKVPWWQMTIIDATDIVEFLIETASKMSKYHRDQPTVGGPIDILVIRKSGATWYKRKGNDY